MLWYSSKSPGAGLPRGVSITLQLSAEGRAEGAVALDAAEELVVQDDGAVEHLPAHNAELIERVALVSLVEVGELHLVQHHLAERTAPEDERRVDGQARARSRRRRLRTAYARDDHRAVRCH